MYLALPIPFDNPFTTTSYSAGHSAHVPPAKFRSLDSKFSFHLLANATAEQVHYRCLTTHTRKHAIARDLSKPADLPLHCNCMQKLTTICTFTVVKSAPQIHVSTYPRLQSKLYCLKRTIIFKRGLEGENKTVVLKTQVCVYEYGAQESE